MNYANANDLARARASGGRLVTCVKLLHLPVLFMGAIIWGGGASRAKLYIYIRTQNPARGENKRGSTTRETSTLCHFQISLATPPPSLFTFHCN